jgi:glycosyltransferase involved in cell wall biosynthesis
VTSSPVPPPAEAPQRILVVSSYPPHRDGIGAYAVQQVRALRRAGHHVEVCSPVPSAAHHHIHLVGPNGAHALKVLMAGFDRVIVHFHPDFFYVNPSTGPSRVATGFALARAFRSGPPVEIRLHEVDVRWASKDAQVELSTRSGRVAELAFEAAARASRAVFQAADRVTVHDEVNRDRMVHEFRVPASRVELVEHGSDFEAHTAITQAEARASLGLPEDEHVFVCIGFIQPHKGFDRAAVAFRGLVGRGASLHIVGSIRVDEAAAAAHRRELETLEAEVDGVHLHLGYVSDDAFDRWIVAADTVVLPYRHIWSSSVAERARLLGRPVIASRVGGLAHQLDEDAGSVLVGSDDDLARAMATALTGGSPAGDVGHPAVERWEFDGPVDRPSVMAEINRRSAALRGTRVAATTAVAPGRARADASVAVPLRRVGNVPIPTATSARPGVGLFKTVVRRIIGWELDPLRHHLVEVQQAALQSAETTDAHLAQLDHDHDRSASD